MMPDGCTTWGGGLDRDRPFDVAVVIQTILRPSLVRAVQSVFDQQYEGTVQVLVGVDAREHAFDMTRLTGRVPANMALTLVDPGYSTSRQRGGVHDTLGGALRTALSYLANSPLVAYLDDDCWWDHRHLETMTAAVHLRDWAYSLRWYVGPGTNIPICVDSFELVGPSAGAYAVHQGGFCDTNTLLIDKTRCPEVLPLWSRALRGNPQGRGMDRVVFDALRQHDQFGSTAKATVFYELGENDEMHQARIGYMATRLKPLSGPALFAAGDFIAAAIDFYRHHYVNDAPETGLAWAYCGLMRGGDRGGARGLRARLDPGNDPVAAALVGSPDTTALPADATMAGRLLFFRAERALIDGDEAAARRLFAEALERGSAEQPEVACARAELERLGAG